MRDTKTIHVEVVYATPTAQAVITLEIAAGATLETVIRESGILVRFPEIDLLTQKIGVFSQRREPQALAKEGDRIEIYRPLQMDPKEARRKKAQRAQLAIS